MIYGDNLIYVRIDWENYPSDKTPLNEYNLNKMDLAIFQTDERVKWLNDNKFDKADSFKLVKNVELEEATGIFTITYFDGSTAKYDTLLEKIAVNFDYDEIAQRLVIMLDDGETKYIDLSALVTQYEFMNSETIHFSVESREEKAFDDSWSSKKISISAAENPLWGNAHERIFIESDLEISSISGTWVKKGETASSPINFTWNPPGQNRMLYADFPGGAISYTIFAETEEDIATGEENRFAGYYSKTGLVSAEIKEGSIQEKHLRPDYLADIKLEGAKVQMSMEHAENSAKTAELKAEEAADSALMAKSYSDGSSGAREGEETDNSKYYSEQSKNSSEIAGEYLEKTEQAWNEALEKVEQETNYAVDKVEQAGNEAVNKVNEALDMNEPHFLMDLSTGHLMYSGGRFVFNVNNAGHLEWGLAV